MGSHRAQGSSLRPSRALPRVGIAIALGLATIVTPLLGVGPSDGAPSADAASEATVISTRTVSRAAAVPSVPPAPLRSHFRVVPQATPEVAAAPARLVADPAEPLTVEELGSIRTQAEKASRGQARAVLADCPSSPVAPDAQNGRLDTSELCEIWADGLLLRSDAAIALARLNAEYASTWGQDLCLTDAYRSYGQQVAVRSAKPGLAARPGTSQHGWGLAVDLCDAEASTGTDRAVWMVENAPAFGWDNPDWARPGGSGPLEPWHWEFVAGQGGPDRS